MSDMHVITGDGKGTWRVVMHFDVPNVNNAVDVNYRTALKNSGMVDAANPSVLPDGTGTEGSISTTEKQELMDGLKHEYVASLTIDGNGATTASRVAILRTAYARLEIELRDKLKEQLKFFGHNEAKA